MPELPTPPCPAAVVSFAARHDMLNVGHTTRLTNSGSQHRATMRACGSFLPPLEADNIPVLKRSPILAYPLYTLGRNQGFCTSHFQEHGRGNSRPLQVTTGSGS